MATDNFTDAELVEIASNHDRPIGGGPRVAYAEWLGDPGLRISLNTEHVENFIINFYTQYNNRFGTRY
jgi:hypothetical protein